MRRKRALSLCVLCAAICGAFAVLPVRLGGQQSNHVNVRIDADDIGGVVTGVKGPEAGVWVIAETTDLPTKYAKIVVTDEALRSPRSSESQLHCVGARLWLSRFAKD